MIHLNDDNAGGYDILVLMQRGVYVRRPGDCSVAEFICNLLGLTLEAMTRDIKTIMMDNKVVDDPLSESMRGSSTLVLSGAMPGLVGAMLRSDSPYKAMRATITSAGAVSVDSPMITIRLFNTVMRKYSERMVQHGFWIDGEDG